MRKQFCLQFQASQFASQINLQIKFLFESPSWTPLSHFILICLESYNFRDPFKIQWAPKWHPKSPSGAQNAEQILCPNAPACVLETDSLPKRRPKNARSHFKCLCYAFWDSHSLICEDFSNKFAKNLKITSRKQLITNAHLETQISETTPEQQAANYKIGRRRCAPPWRIRINN